ncbi:MAG: hypothetical protein M3Z09_08095, partial [Acidobacteriota bacterium]|nr:hypothetical protein [Acidobacteriota bacterium]
YFMFGGAKGCCAPDGHCKTTTAPNTEASGPQCRLIAFEHRESVNLRVDLPVAGILTGGIPLVTTNAPANSLTTKPREPFPPDLQVLHSTFLI